jgi:hypothetical protein
MSPGSEPLSETGGSHSSIAPREASRVAGGRGPFSGGLKGTATEAVGPFGPSGAERRERTPPRRIAVQLVDASISVQLRRQHLRLLTGSSREALV